MENIQDFWCHPNADASQPVVKILIPKICPKCFFVLEVDLIGCICCPSVFKTACEHFAFYGSVWENRIQINGVGATCSKQTSTKCSVFYPHADNYAGFVCFACRSGW